MDPVHVITIDISSYEQVPRVMEDCISYDPTITLTFKVLLNNFQKFVKGQKEKRFVAISGFLDLVMSKNIKLLILKTEEMCNLNIILYKFVLNFKQS